MLIEGAFVGTELGVSLGAVLTEGVELGATLVEGADETVGTVDGTLEA